MRRKLQKGTPMNTLYKYFPRTPPVLDVPVDPGPSSSNIPCEKTRNEKRVRDHIAYNHFETSGDEDDIPIGNIKKLRPDESYEEKQDEKCDREPASTSNQLETNSDEEDIPVENSKKLRPAEAYEEKQDEKRNGEQASTSNQFGTNSDKENISIMIRDKSILDPLDFDEPFEENQDEKRDIEQASPSYQFGTNSDEEDIPISNNKKRRLNPLDSDESYEEKQADNNIKTPKEKATFKKILPSPINKKPAKSCTPSVDKKTKGVEEETSNNEEDWIHSKLVWLKPENIKDSKKRKPTDIDYDGGTLYVPPDFYQTQTPAHRQWWEIKSAHFDCVLFFKVGKFYELYHMDAEIGVTELQLSYMKGEFAHSGFPESAYGKMSSTLVAKGYKVARVEQTETPEMMQQRCKITQKHSKWDKVVRREVCQVTQLGTQVCGLQDPGLNEARATYMFAVCEEESQLGVCFVDTSIGCFHLGQFKDDKHSSRLLTTLAHYPPALVVYDRRSMTPRTIDLLSTHCHSARRETRHMESAERTLGTIFAKYFDEWPKGIKPFLDEGDVLGLTPAADCSLAIKALGGCVAHLRDSFLDIQILGMSQFTSYTPVDMLNKNLLPEKKDGNPWEGGSTMVLDSITLKNLRIFKDTGCLYDKLNFCLTAMGKRMLHQWLCAPSCDPSVIRNRQAAVEYLHKYQDLRQSARKTLSALPDLERLLSRLHTLGNAQRSKNHPDSRAVFYEEKVYVKRNILDFIAVLRGFTKALELVTMFDSLGGYMVSDLTYLDKVTHFEPRGIFPDYRETLKFFKEAFDVKKAEKEGLILPAAGVDDGYDKALNAISEIEADLKKYLNEQQLRYGTRLSYVGTAKKRYQIEMTASAASKAGADYQLESTRKGFKRFSTPTSRRMLAEMLTAEEVKNNVLKDLNRRMFEKFTAHYDQWKAALKCIATVDVLLSLAEFASQQTGAVCLPKVTFDSETKPFINITDGRHPCIPVVDFIPNETVLGTDANNLLLLTGPNMGGKTTLMRQVGLLTVLAHIGSFVPAEKCELSLVDRIFTRVGASDSILTGTSTFLVEMKETEAILSHATVHSLVLLDELGRGTSTKDGMAIAYGVCGELAGRGCRVLFSTHYHSLVHHMSEHPGVQLGHMACMVETEKSAPESEDSVADKTVTFLYKLSPGACPKSYGFNTARLAGIDKHIIKKAHELSKKLDDEDMCMRTVKAIMHTDEDYSQIWSMLQNLTV